MVILYSVSCEFKSACTVREFFFLNVPDFRLPVFNLDCIIDCQDVPRKMSDVHPISLVVMPQLS